MKIKNNTIVAAIGTFIFFSFFSLLVEHSALCAPTEDSNASTTAEKKPELPKSGSLSTSGDFGYRRSAVGGEWGGTDQQGKDVAPISGSVSKLSDNEWVMKAFNNSKDTYSVSLEVAQYGVNGQRLKGDFFSYTLRPSQNVERKISASPSTKSCDLKLQSWKKIGSSEKSSK